MSPRPFLAKVDGRDCLLVRDDQMRSEYLKKHPKVNYQDVGRACISLFREQPDVDYLGVGFIDSSGNENWTLSWVHELLTWMGGVAINAERQRVLEAAERANGNFHDRFGWAPIIAIEDKPTQFELEMYGDYLIEKGKGNFESLLEETNEEE